VKNRDAGSSVFEQPLPLRDSGFPGSALGFDISFAGKLVDL
jgi:hypothetical protein